MTVEKLFAPSDAARILGATIAGTADRDTVLLFGWRRPTADGASLLTLALDGTIFGAIEAGDRLGVEFPVPEGTLPFAYPLPPAALDGGEHAVAVAATAEALATAVAVSIRLPHHAPPPRKPRAVSVCAIVKDEAPYLLEWYAHHRMLGVEHFHIYDNESTDGTTAILNALARQGDVTVRHWPSAGMPSPQVDAYNHALATASAETEWLLFIDIDEFLVLDRHARVQDFLSWHQGAGAVSVNWAIFGSAGKERREDRPVTERFARRAPSDFSVNRHVKTFARTAATRRIAIHHVVLNDGALCVTPSGRRIDTATFAGLTDAVDWPVARLHHYFCKSREEWAIKRARGKADHPLESTERFRGDHEFDLHDRNEEADDTLARRSPLLAAEIARLAADCPALAQAGPVASEFLGSGTEAPGL